MSSEQQASVKPLLFDKEYWCRKLEFLETIPRRLLIVPRPELARPGTEVSELKLRAHDGERLSALLGRSAFALEGQPVVVRLIPFESLLGVRWESLEEGQAEIAFRPPGDRRLEDRVLDLLRVVDVVASIEGLAESPIRLTMGRGRAHSDEIWIADQVLKTCGRSSD